MSVYRPLFNELSKDLFDIVKGITEQAVARAKEREALFKIGPVGMVLNLSNDEPVATWLQKRYGWKRHAISRCAYNESVEVAARLLCGHVTQYLPISERALHLSISPAEAFMIALDKAVQNSPRGCYCVQREEE